MSNFDIKLKIIIIVLLSFGTFLWLTGCSGEGKNSEEKVSPTSDDSPTVTVSPTASPEKVIHDKPIKFKQTKLRSRKDGKKTWVLEANQITYDEKNRWAMARQITCIFFGPDGKKTVEVMARAVRVNLKNDSLNFIGQVNVNTSDGKVMKIKKFRWDGEKEKFYGEKSTSVVGDGTILTAEQMIADPAMKELHFTGGVKVKYPDPDDVFKF